MLYKFGPYTLDTQTEELRRHLNEGFSYDVVPLRHQARALLEFFLANADKVVSKQEAWATLPRKQNDEFGYNPVSFDRALGDLRRALGDDGETYIKRVRLNHLRFICPVEKIDQSPETSQRPKTDGADPLDEAARETAATTAPANWVASRNLFRRWESYLLLALICFGGFAAAFLGRFLVKEYYRPRPVITYAWGFGFTKPFKDEPHTFASGVLDLYYQTPTAVPGTMTQYKFPSERDYTLVRNVQTYLGALMIENRGHSTANQIKLGLRFEFPVLNLKVVGTPNVHINHEAIPDLDESSLPHEIISVDRLGPNENTLLQLSWEHRAPAANALGEALQMNRFYLPQIVFVTSEESIGRVERFMPFAAITANAKYGFSTGFMKSLLKVKGGSRIEWETLDSDAYKMEGVVPALGDNPSAEFQEEVGEYVPEEP